MKRCFTYRLYPTRRQVRELDRQLEVCRLAWNLLIEDHLAAHTDGARPPSRYDQTSMLTEIKHLWPELGLQTVHAQAIQNVATRVSDAIARGRTNKKRSGLYGRPRFRGEGRYDSLTFPQVPYGCRLFEEQGRVRVSHVGHVKVKIHRPLQGKPKTATVRRTPTGKWFVTFACEDVPERRLPPSKREVGIDLGVKEFAVLSTGTVIHNPRHLDRDAGDLSRVQRMRDRSPHGSEAFRRRAKVVARVHERIANRRTDFLNKTAVKVLRDNGTVYVENLNPSSMGRSRRERRGIMDAAWSSFIRKLESKAEEAGTRTIVKVPPAFTSRTCSVCGWVMPTELRGVTFRCGRAGCGHRENRDLNAARNILGIGQYAKAAMAAAKPPVGGAATVSSMC